MQHAWFRRNESVVRVRLFSQGTIYPRGKFSRLLLIFFSFLTNIILYAWREELLPGRVRESVKVKAANTKVDVSFS